MDPAYIAAIKANARPLSAGPGRAKFVNGQYVLEEPAKKKKSKGWLSSIISEASGLGGAGIGAAIGSAAGPIGTLVGAGIGGFVGGTGGRVAENKVRDNRVGLGDALKEGALMGVLAPGPLKLGKAAFGASKAAVGGTRGVAALTQAAEKQASKSLLTGAPGTKWASSAAQRLESRSAGVGVGEKLPGKEALWPDAQKNVLKTLRDYGANVGARDTAAGKIQIALNQARTELKDAIAQNNRKLSPVEIKGLVSTYRNTLKTDFSPKDVLEHSKDFERLLKSVKTTGDIPRLRTTLYEQTRNFAQNPDAALQAKQAASKKLTPILNKFLDKTSPAIRAADKEVARLSTAGDYVVNAAGRLTRASQTSGGSIVSKTLSGDTAQSLKGKLGSAIVNRKPGVSPLGAVVKGSAGGLSRAIGGEQEQPEEVNTVEGIGQEGYGPEIYDNPDFPTGEAPMPPGLAPQSAYSLEQAMADLANPRNASPKAQQQIMDRYDFISKAEAAQQKIANPKLSAEQQKRLMNADVMSSTLDSLEQSFASFNQPSSQAQATAKGLYSGTIGRLVDENTKVYLDQIRLDAIRAIRSAGEVGNLSSSEQSAALRSVPGLGDTAQGAQKKIDRLRALLIGAQQKAVYSLGQQGYQEQGLAPYINQGGY